MNKEEACRQVGCKPSMYCFSGKDKSMPENKRLCDEAKKLIINSHKKEIDEIIEFIEKRSLELKVISKPFSSMDKDKIRKDVEQIYLAIS